MSILRNVFATAVDCGSPPSSSTRISRLNSFFAHTDVNTTSASGINDRAPTLPLLNVCKPTARNHDAGTLDIAAAVD